MQDVAAAQLAADGAPAPGRAASGFKRLVTRAAFAAAAVVVFVTVADLLLIPLHRRGVAQSPLGVLNGLSRTLQIPALVVSQAGVPWQFGREMTFAEWVVVSACTFAFYLTVFTVLGVLNRWVNRRLRLASAPQVEPLPASAISRRRLLRATKTVVVTGAAAGALGYPIAWEPRRYVVSRRTFPLRGLPPSLDGLRIVQLTDIHLGPWLSESYVRRIVESANALDPDVITLTGDYVLHSPEYITPVAGILAGLRAKVGIVGVLGNHDWREDGRAMRKALAATGVRMLDNGRAYVSPVRELRPDATVADGLCIAGVGDLWTDRQFYGRALEGVPETMPRLLLSHNPDVAEERAFVSSGYRVDLMLSGHTHGGQIYVPGLGTPVLPSRYGQKYALGLVQGPVCPVFVSCGLGTALLPLRVGVPPEIAVIELKRA